jgi:pyruvate formate lyase activating enzyme
MADIGGIARFAAGLGNVERVDVLPFHQLGKYKWERLGMRYTLADTQPPSNAAVEQVCRIFRAEGLSAH